MFQSVRAELCARRHARQREKGQGWWRHPRCREGPQPAGRRRLAARRRECAASCTRHLQLGRALTHSMYTGTCSWAEAAGSCCAARMRGQGGGGRHVPACLPVPASLRCSRCAYTHITRTTSVARSPCSCLLQGHGPRTHARTHHAHSGAGEEGGRGGGHARQIAESSWPIGRTDGQGNGTLVTQEQYPAPQHAYTKKESTRAQCSKQQKGGVATVEVGRATRMHTRNTAAAAREGRAPAIGAAPAAGCCFGRARERAWAGGRGGAACPPSCHRPPAPAGGAAAPPRARGCRTRTQLLAIQPSGARGSMQDGAAHATQSKSCPPPVRLAADVGGGGQAVGGWGRAPAGPGAHSSMSLAGEGLKVEGALQHGRAGRSEDEGGGRAPLLHTDALAGHGAAGVGAACQQYWCQPRLHHTASPHANSTWAVWLPLPPGISPLPQPQAPRARPRRRVHLTWPGAPPGGPAKLKVPPCAAMPAGAPKA
jgi:hypothetical protein